MNFERLYGPELNLLLNDSDSNVLYTSTRRQQAINDGMAEFAALTECYQLRATIPLSCSVSEYILSTLYGFVRMSGSPLAEYRLLSSGGSSINHFTVRAGYDFPQVDESWLNRYASGWRQSTATTIRPVQFPRAYYVRSGISALIGLSDPPDIGSSETATLLFGFISKPEPMTASTSIPFTYNSGDVRLDLETYHQAFPHYAAYKLLPLTGRMQEAAQNLQIFQNYVERYKSDYRPRGGGHVTFARQYFGDARRSNIGYDASIANDPTWRWR